MKKFLTTLLMGTVFTLSACSTQTALLKNNQGKLNYENSQSFFFWGIGQEKTVNAVEICKGEENIAQVESQLTGSNILLGIVTLGIYSPRTARVYCQ